MTLARASHATTPPMTIVTITKNHTVGPIQQRATSDILFIK